MLKGFWLCLRKCPKPPLITFVCIVWLVYVLKGAIMSVMNTRMIEVYNHTGSVSQESLEILICPMPRVHVGRIMHFEGHLRSLINLLYFNTIVWPVLNFKSPALEPLLYVTQCMEMKKHVFRRTDSAAEMIKQMQTNRDCWPTKIRYDNKLFNYEVRILSRLQNIYLDNQMTRFLYRHFGSLDERLLEDYDRLFNEAWVLAHENRTLDDLIDFISVDLTRHLDHDDLASSLQDVTGPLQTIDQGLVGTRMASMCFRQVLHASAERGHQRSTIVYPFNDNCPKEPASTFPKGSLCLGTKDMYASVYITAINKFTDIPMAAVIVPYRVAIDRHTTVHVSVQKRIHAEQCVAYDGNRSQVTCLEDCLLARVLDSINCTVPWLRRLQQRNTSEEVVQRRANGTDLLTCTTQEELLNTMSTVQHVFDEKAVTSCGVGCPRDCQQLTITPRVMGAVDDARARLELLISDRLPVFVKSRLYGVGQFVAEVMGSLSFIIGVSAVALYDWLIGVSLWAIGKLPFIPAIPPVLKHELYTDEACSCTEADEPRRLSVAERRRTMLDDELTDDSDTYLAASFRHSQRRRTTLVKVASASQEAVQRKHSDRRQAIVTFPMLSMRASAIDTMAHTLASAESGHGWDETHRHSSQAKVNAGGAVRRASHAPLRRASHAPPRRESHVPPRTDSNLPPINSDRIGGANLTAHEAKESAEGAGSRSTPADPTAADAGPVRKDSPKSSDLVLPAEDSHSETSEFDKELRMLKAALMPIVPQAEASPSDAIQQSEQQGRRGGLPDIGIAAANLTSRVHFDMLDVERALSPEPEPPSFAKLQSRPRALSRERYKSRPRRATTARPHDVGSADADDHSTDPPHE